MMTLLSAGLDRAETIFRSRAVNLVGAAWFGSSTALLVEKDDTTDVCIAPPSTFVTFP